MAVAADNVIPIVTPRALFEALIQPEEGARRLLAREHLPEELSRIVAAYLPPRPDIPILRDCYQTIRVLGLEDLPMPIPTLGNIFEKIQRPCPIMRGQMKPDGTPYKIEDTWSLQLIPSRPGEKVSLLVNVCQRLNPRFSFNLRDEDSEAFLERDLGDVRWVWMYRGILPDTAGKHCEAQELAVADWHPSVKMIKATDAVAALFLDALRERVFPPAIPYAIHHQYEDRSIRAISYFERNMSADDPFDHEYVLISLWNGVASISDTFSGGRFTNEDWVAGVTLREDSV